MNWAYFFFPLLSFWCTPFVKVGVFSFCFFFWGGVYLSLLRKKCEEGNQKDTEMTAVSNHTRDSSREKVGV